MKQDIFHLPKEKRFQLARILCPEETILLSSRAFIASEKYATFFTIFLCLMAFSGENFEQKGWNGVK